MSVGEQCNVSRVGGFRTLWLATSFFLDPVRCMDRHLSRLGRSVELRLPLSRRRTFVPLLFLVGPDFNKEVLTNVESLSPTGIWPGPAPRGTAQRELGRNYMKKHGVEHDHYAKAVMPHVSRARVDHRFDLVRARAIDQIENWPIGKTVDAYALARALIQHAAFAALFGEQDEERIGILGRLLHDRNVLNWSRAARALRLDAKGLPYGRMLRNAEALQAFVHEWIEESRGCPHERDLRALFANMPGIDGNPPPMSLVVANLAMLAFASYGTSSTILTWTLFLLAQHPAIMADLVDELSAAGPIEDMELAGLSSLPLLDAVLKEAMRLITPVPFLGFRAVGPCEIAGRQLDRGARVAISPHLTHRMPEIYDAPDRFRPHRWFEIKPTSYEYLPFSAGARRCPGSLFATMVLKTMLAVILSRYRVTVSRGARIDYAFAGIIVPKRGVPMQLERQDRAFRANPCTGSIFELLKSDAPV